MTDERIKELRELAETNEPGCYEELDECLDEIDKLRKEIARLKLKSAFVSVVAEDFANKAALEEKLCGLRIVTFSDTLTSRGWMKCGK
jgi:uncharacterized coiled-coil DUF342 family protein